MSSAVIAGGTGLVGSNILSTLISHPAFTTTSAFTRRKLPIESTKVTSLENKDSESWPALFPRSPVPSILFSALGTTRAQAGSVANQRKIDLDLSLALAKEAKEAGVQTYVLISTAGANAASSMAYPQMKGELEESVKKLGFKHTIILKPGLIVGTREDSRPPEAVLRSMANFMGSVSGGRLKDFWAQDADVIARAAVNAAYQTINGNKDEGLWLLTQTDIVRLGRTEWTVPHGT
ncbi:NAD dependent epimerase/dehydratase family protein-like protein [Tothia fuscella]|uniref:NAD dependent epimerase/dehydratase family protein-like protein n=1 Tax=Tothia fuscella TaxID=1048955 RepID=A0A9P4NVB8_9PEZI|nr:NAD dependent epimerase/dehydratase family protein-like protein [Tothia fuscella]